MIIAPRMEPVIIDSNVDVEESGIDVYSDDTDYIVGDYTQVNGTFNRIYRCISDSTGLNPSLDVNAESGTGSKWIDKGSTNYYRAFDVSSSSKCKNSESIYYKFAVNDVDVLMLSGLKALSVRVVTSSADDTVIFDKTYDTSTRDVYDWQDWLTAPLEFMSSFFAIIPFGYGLNLEVFIENAGGDAEVGHFVFGRSKSVGLSLMDPAPTSTMRSLTSKSRDSNGNIITRKITRFKRMNITCLIDSKSIDIIEDRLNSLADTPCIFVGDDSDGGYKALLIYGEIKDHDMPIGVSKTTYKLEVEGYI